MFTTSLTKESTKKEKLGVDGLFYGRFLSSRIPTMAIAMIMAITPIAKYIARSVVVARFVWETAVGMGVGAAWSTANAVTACEGQYDSLPSNEA